MNKISIALCTYNGAKFLEDQLESFLTQTRQPDELVICDDRSTDETIEIIEDFRRRAPFPIVLHRNEINLGSTKNFEQAIALCTGDLIFLADQDDVWMPAKLEKFARVFEKSASVGMVFSDAEIVDENLRSANCRLWDFTFSAERRTEALNGNIFQVFLAQNAVTGATMAFRAERRNDFIPIPENIPNLIHDGWISLVIAAQADVVFIEEPLIKYRQHTAQQLGIGYEAALARDFTQRKNRYAASVEMNLNEIERLKQMEQLFAVYSQFEKWRDRISFTDLIEEKSEKIKHYEARGALPRRRVERIIPVGKEVMSGRYRRFSKVFFSPAKDLLEKW